MTNLKGWNFAHHHDILLYSLSKSGESKKVKESGKEKNLKEDIAKRGENFHNFGHCASKELDTNVEWVTLRDQSTFNISCRDSFFGSKPNGSANVLQWKSTLQNVQRLSTVGLSTWTQRAFDMKKKSLQTLRSKN